MCGSSRWPPGRSRGAPTEPSLAVSRLHVGVRFGSNLDDQPCYALFEGRAELQANGDHVQLTPDLEPLQQVCQEFGLKLV
jgi:hypothetical protein